MENTVILYTYKYIWKEKGSDKLCVKFITGAENEHISFQETIRSSEAVESCYFEYVHEVNMAYFGYTQAVKVKEKEEDIHEKV